MIDKKNLNNLEPQKEKLRKNALDEMFKLQESFLQKFAINKMMPQGEREKWTKETIIAMMSELSELLEEINWKHWKKERKEVNYQSLKFEIADIFHFAINFAVIWGMSSDDLWRYFKAKSEENINRQKKGY